MRPWELHPALIHFPIAFLIGAWTVDLVARVRRSEPLARVGAGLLVAGVASGILAAAAGAIAYFTVPAHTEAAHGQMTAHLALAAAALALFALVAVARWRHRARPASALSLVAGVAASGLLVGAAFLGGRIVYQGGAGIDPEILAPAVVAGHHHHDHDEDAEPSGETHDHADEHAAEPDEHAAEPEPEHPHEQAPAPAARRPAPDEHQHRHQHKHLYDPSEGLDSRF